MAKSTGPINVVTIAPFLPRNPSAGHTYWFHNSMSSAFLDASISFTVIGPKASANDLSIGLLSSSVNRRIKSTYFPLIGINRDLREIIKFLSTTPGSQFLHIYEGGIREFLLFALLLKKEPKLFGLFNFFLVDPWLTIANIDRNSRRYRSFMRIITFLNDRAVITFETKELKTAMGFNLLNNYGDYPLFTTVNTKEAFRRSRNYALIAAPAGDSELRICLNAIENASLLLGRKLSFLIHMRWGTEASAELIQRIKKLGGDLVNSKLTETEYTTLYRNSEIAILPYQSKSHYAYQTSGRLLDAIALGCSVIVPSETVLSRVVEESCSGETFDPYSAAELANAIVTLIKKPAKSTLRVPTAIDAARQILKLIGNKERSKTSNSFRYIDVLSVGFSLIFFSPKEFLVGLAYVSGLPLHKLARIMSVIRRIGSNRENH